MGYYKELAFALRVRGLDEQQIQDTLEDVQSHTKASGVEPHVDFGAPASYAEQFELRKRMTSGKKFIVGFALGAIAAAALQILVMVLFRVDARIGAFPLFLGIALILVLIGLVGGFLLDRRLPRGFSEND